MIRISRALGTFIFLATCIPVVAAAQAPGVALVRSDSLRIDLPESRSVVVLGLSWYADVMLLYPAPASDVTLPTGSRVIPLDYDGPWLRGGRPKMRRSSTSDENFYCTGHGSLIQQVKQMSGQRDRQLCTYLPPIITMTEEWPVLRHLVILSTRPDSAALPLEHWLTQLEIPEKSAAVAAALVAHLNRLDTNRTWWASGHSIKRPTDGPRLRTIGPHVVQLPR